MSLENKKILLVIGGGISAYKSLDLIRLFQKKGCSVKIVLTKSGKKFVTSLSLSSLSKNRVFEEVFNEKNKGNILRITDLFKNYKIKKRKEIEPVGFVIGNTNLYLTNTDGKIIIADLSEGKVLNVEKVSGDIVSEPFIFNNNLYVVRNGSIVQYN